MPQPYVPHDARVAEFSWVPLFTGALLGIVFGASSLYLALKVGMTVSASIPIAVISITLFKGISKIFGIRRTTILENNLVQTTGSAGESIAFGVAVTMPALLILGYNLELDRVLLVAVLGGLLGVLMMIPLRRALIVEEHGKLPYPEGTACAEVLIVGELGGTSAKTVFTGFFAGLFYKIANVGFRLWNDVPEKIFAGYKGSSISGEVSPELLGVGYIIGLRISAIMVGGGILSSWVLTPLIYLFGGALKEPIFPATKLISEMSIHEVWRNYVLYIGAGAVAAGGIISLVQSLPTILRSARAGVGKIRTASGGKTAGGIKRTDQDLSNKFVIAGIFALIAMIWMAPSLQMNLFGAVLVVVFGFLFVAVSSRLTGQIGSSSNPISGMTVATLLLVSLIFLSLGWVSPGYRLTALSIAAVVCIATSNGGTTSQDLKTGFLVGATPRYQQIGLLIGAVSSALVIGWTLKLLNDASTIYSRKYLPTSIVSNIADYADREAPAGPAAESDQQSYHVVRVTEAIKEGALAGVPIGKYLVDDAGKFQYLVDPGINGNLKNRDDGTPVQKYEAPKARLMSMIIDGILTRKLPWGLVLVGVAIAAVLELCGISALPFAVGVYLPLSASTPIFAGGLLRWLTGRLSREKNAAESETSPGVLFSSGLIAGGSIAGIGLAILSLKEKWAEAMNFSSWFPALTGSNTTSVVVFGLLGLFLLLVGTGKLLRQRAHGVSSQSVDP